MSSTTPTSSVCEYYFNDSFENKIRNFKSSLYDLSLVNLGTSNSSPTISTNLVNINGLNTFGLYQNTDSSSNYSYYANKSILNMNNFSISCWITNGNLTSNLGVIFSICDVCNNLISVSYNNDNQIILSIGITNKQNMYYTGFPVNDTGNNHILLTCSNANSSGTTIKVYVNGVKLRFNETGNYTYPITEFYSTYGTFEWNTTPYNEASGDYDPTGWSVILNNSLFNNNNYFLYVLGGPYPPGLTLPAAELYSNGPESYVSQLTLYNTELTQSEVTYLYNNIFIPPHIPCFLEGSKILKLDQDIDEETYVPVETLRPGDLIKTYLNGYRPVVYIGKKTISTPSDKSDIRNHLYKFVKSKIPGMTDDLFITGEHCTLHKTISQEMKEKVKSHMGDIYITEYQFRVPACIDKRAEQYRGNYPVTIWHFALENDDDYYNYGVYANGLLVESCSIQYLLELSNMKIIQ